MDPVIQRALQIGLVETTTSDTDNFYINDSDKTKIVTNSASASIKIKYKPN